MFARPGLRWRAGIFCFKRNVEMGQEGESAPRESLSSRRLCQSTATIVGIPSGSRHIAPDAISPIRTFVEIDDESGIFTPVIAIGCASLGDPTNIGQKGPRILLFLETGQAFRLPTTCSNISRPSHHLVKTTGGLVLTHPLATCRHITRCVRGPFRITKKDVKTWSRLSGNGDLSGLLFGTPCFALGRVFHPTRDFWLGGHPS